MAIPIGYTIVDRPAIVVQATPDYSDGDCVGGLISLTNHSRRSGGSGLLTRLQLRSLISIGVDMAVHIFDSNPADSTFTDNAAMSIHANDRAKLLKSYLVETEDWVAPIGSSPWYTVEVLTAGEILPFELASGRDLYMALRAAGAINFAATDELAAIVASEQN